MKSRTMDRNTSRALFNPVKVELLGHEIDIDESLIEQDPEEIRRQLEEYIDGEKTEFELSLSIPDSFTGRVMTAMLEIGYGETATYGDLAQKLGTSAVAVGQACGRNPVPVIVPCHRVVSREGIGGYQYPGLKQRLLVIEKETRYSQ